MKPTPATALKDTDRCVMCGLCLPHCPTYLKTRDEAESPRGRIALMQGMASGRLPINDKLIAHLDHCLACRACEKVCPSKVPYGRLIDSARAQITHTARPLSRLAQLGLRSLLQPQHLRRLARLLRFYQRSGLRRLLRTTGLLRALRLDALDTQLPPVPAPRNWPAYTPAHGPHRGDVALFLGCAAGPLDQATHAAAIALLTRCGFGVHIPAMQTCCGALHRHLGAAEDADALIARNNDAFSNRDCQALITTTSACGVHLAEQGNAQPPVRDISDFLAEHWPASLTLQPLQAMIAVHEPCTHRNGPLSITPVYELLRRLPDAAITALDGNAQCCGAAGSYMLSEPAMAHALRADKLAAIDAQQPDILVTSNFGCALHLAAGLREDGRPVEVIHPVQLLARQLPLI